MEEDWKLSSKTSSFNDKNTCEKCLEEFFFNCSNTRFITVVSHDESNLIFNSLNI